VSAGWKRVFHVTDGIVIPVIIAGAFALLFIEGKPRGVAAILFCVATAVMIGLWNLMRELRAHATATRAAAVGEPDELIELARTQIARRLTQRSRAPFYVYLALGHQLRGDWDDATRALDRALEYRPLKIAWRLLAATARLGIQVEQGDAAAARKTFDNQITPVAQRLAGPGVKLLAEEAEARVRFAEGDAAGAAPMFERMCGDVRLGPATRALAHWYAARCAEARGDRATADRHFADAAKLAPKTFVAKRPTA
jgi:tetratricopeptide (TPR) repeat protein